MIADAPRTKDLTDNEDDFFDYDDSAPVLSSKEDIKNLLKGQL